MTDDAPARSAGEFERAYAARSHVTVVLLYESGRQAMPCDCGETGCEGWQMAHVPRACYAPEHGEQCTVSGKPWSEHYGSPAQFAEVEKRVLDYGPGQRVTVPCNVCAGSGCAVCLMRGSRSFLVPRHYITTHGVKSDTLAEVAAHCAFPEWIDPVPTPAEQKRRVRR